MANDKGEMAMIMYGTEIMTVFVPNNRIMVDKAEYVYAPCRGFSASLAVFDLDDRCIGWIAIGDLGYANVKRWMIAVDHPGCNMGGNAS